MPIRAALSLIPKPLIFAAGGLVIAIALMTLIYQAGKSAGEDRVMTQWKEAESNYAAAAASILREYRDTERQWAQELQETTSAFQERIAITEAGASSTIADLRAGNLQLRERFRSCSTTAARMPDAAPAPGSDNEPGDTGLSDADAGFLIRLAARADRVTNQLGACQAYVEAITARPQPESR